MRPPPAGRTGLERGRPHGPQRRPCHMRDLRPAFAPCGPRPSRPLPPLRRRAGGSQALFHPEDLGPDHCRRNLLHPGQYLSRHGFIQFGKPEHDTIIDGVIILYKTGSWHLALIVLIASVFIPLAKLGALAYLLVTIQRQSVKSSLERLKLYRMVEFIGRWSMLDVFVVAFTVALIQLGPLMEIHPGAGVVYFAAVVVLTMIAAETFDSRLIWDAEKMEGSLL